METYKYCSKCMDSKPASSFYKNRAKKDGVATTCKACFNEYLKERNKSGFRFQRPKPIPKIEDLTLSAQPTKIQQIVYLLAGDPKIACEDIAIKLQLAPETVRGYMGHNKFLVALRNFGSQRLTQMIPQAIQTLNSSLTAKSEDVQLKAAVKVLENEKILGPERVDVTVNDLSNKRWDELVAMLESSPKPLVPTIDAEFIS